MVMEEKVYKANRISLELLEQLNTQVIVEYGSLIYYPFKGDEIDMQLADYTLSLCHVKGGMEIWARNPALRAALSGQAW